MSDDDLRHRVFKAESALISAGFRRCEIAACNCNSWHQVEGFKARFDDIMEAVVEAGYSTNGRILLDVVKEIADKARKYDDLSK